MNKTVIKTLKKTIKSIIQHSGYDISLNKISPHAHKGNKIAFIHIPKCGGISVDTALRSKLARSGERKITRKPLIDSSLFSFDKPLITPDDLLDFSEHHSQELQRALVYHLNLNWHYVSGHLPINRRILEHFTNQYRFITVLRNPVERFISNYIFNKQTNTMAIMPPNCLNNDNLIEEANAIVNSRRGWQMANTTTMFLTGRYPKDTNDAVNMQAEVANNLTKFATIGFLDDLPLFEKSCQKLTGETINIGQFNITNDNSTSQQVQTKMVLTEYFNQASTLNKLNKLCKTELSNYQRIKDKCL